MALTVRFAHDNDVAYGVVDGDQVRVITPHPFSTEAVTTGESVSVADVRLLAPVIPTKVICVGRNYAAHADEMGGDAPDEPMLFFKPSSSIVGPGEPIVLPTTQSDHVEHEVELAVVIGALAKNIDRETAAAGAGSPGAVIRGYTIANDVTARDLQASDGQWGRAKGFDSFCPLGPAIVDAVDIADQELRAYVNDELRQKATVAEMIHDVPSIVSFVSRVMTLLPGDVILTGTPSGVGRLEPGDVVRCEIDGLGVLSNPVIDAQAQTAAHPEAAPISSEDGPATEDDR